MIGVRVLWLVGTALLIGVAPVPASPGDARPRPGAVQPCADYGQGFVFVPSTGTCVRLGGRLRADTVARGKAGRSDATALGAEGRLDLDARTPTEYGPLRAVVSVRGRQGGR
ncbi:porin [Chelatococcus sp. SYSU_G07232]|uniref:Porin n=1 Tax=Chelatococcus albus TaxID=3047466 RepID=A0ABT7AEQ1_9HYPH|nr:porin [Chelatococcus sp. SYSU_G07232]MDJ1157842.1 porin [Chelatococcus sp. SYSU_G07232]